MLTVEFVDVFGREFTNPDLEKLRAQLLSAELWFSGYRASAELSWRDEATGRQESLIILGHRELGYYLNFNYMTQEEFVSVGDRNRLQEMVELDQGGVSAGLFVPPEQAWLAVERFCRSGDRTDEIDWLDTADMPPGGCW